ncbi:permease (plasmid) [Gemmatirosa kalamazoonensis]|uniref:Permease n=1 Tax=Gemmatirosa kalamazoonensis TaxID=861299 RepID=W0RSN0_9BACT|nr:ADOP family duplicated permease [Gemmatirosa kalamazoonensis]AHG93315.1 permease [Gemmatirosa kalamazoonensis]
MRELLATVRGWSTLPVNAGARARWSVPWLERRSEDVRHALRGLRRSPGFTAAVVLTLGLGLGGNAALFGAIDRLMLRPFPYLRDASHVDRVYLRTAGWNDDRPYTLYPYTRYRDLARWSTSLAQTAAFTAATHGVGSGEGAREEMVFGVSGDFFALFDARPTSGRFITPSDDVVPTGSDVAVVSYAYWQSALGGRDAIGERLQVGDGSYTIVGIAPRDFAGVAEGRAPAVYVPITAYATHLGAGVGDPYYVGYSWDWVQMLVRRRPGVTRDAATADLTRAFERSWVASRVVHPSYASLDSARVRAIAGPIRTAIGPDPGLEARTLRWVAGVALAVLLIACANVANLFLARALGRRREVALRLALGVSRWRLAAQALTESLLLSLFGVGIGLVVARWTGAALQRLVLADAAPAGTSAGAVIDGRTLVAALVAAVGTAILTGVAPLLFVERTDPIGTLRAGEREMSYRRSPARAVLLLVQCALSVVLLVGAGLFVRSLAHVRALRLGYDLGPLLVARWERRGTPLDSLGEARVRADLAHAALARPEVTHVAWVTNPVFAPGTSTLSLAVPGVDSLRRRGRFTFQTVSGDYFATMGTRIVRGRALTEQDRVGAARVLVVSEAMARALWPGRDPLGRCVRIAWRASADTMPCTTVVGVAENALHDPVADHPMRYYVPDGQLDFRANTMLVRLRTDPDAAAGGVRRALQAALPGAAFVVVRPAQALMDAKRRSWLIGASLFVALGVLAVVVAATGLYGVVAYDVAQRGHELGVRAALGARSTDIVRVVVGQGVRLAAGGVACGTLLALAGSSRLQPLLFQQSARDVRVFGAVAGVLLVVAAAACARPALRAARTDPNIVLRAD